MVARWLPWASKTPQNGKSYCRLLAKSSILWKFKMRIWMRRGWLLRWKLSRCYCIMIGYNHDHHHQLKIIAHCDDKAGIFMGLWLCEIHSVWDTEALPGPAPSLDPLPVVSWSSSLSWQLAILVLLVATVDVSMPCSETFWKKKPKVYGFLVYYNIPWSDILCRCEL